MKRLAFLILLIVVMHQKSNPAANDSELYLNRLPTDLIPELYELEIYFKNRSGIFDYAGWVTIRIRCERNTKEIVLNRQLFKIEKVVVWSSDENNNWKRIEIDDHHEDPSNKDEYKILLTEELKEEKKYWVVIIFKKIYNFETGMIYQSYNRFHNRKLTFTKFEELGARDLFPCFDQPDMKAKFKLWLHHLDSVQALSSGKLMPSDEAALGESEWKDVEFEETDEISTFSLTIAMVDKKKRHKGFSVPFSEGTIDVTVFFNDSRHFVDIQNIISNILSFFSKLFSLPQSLKKLDIVILNIETQFQIKDYYGIIYIRGSSMLELIDKNSNLSEYQVLSEICYAISKQFFGHIVSMSNWYENWIFRGFNNFLRVLCVDQLIPDYETRFSQIEMVNSFIELLESESRGEYNTVSVIKPPTIIRFEFFNEETRIKVNHLIRMMNFFLGASTFREFIKEYLKRFKFKSSTVEDVWDTFSTITKNFPQYITVKNVMESWITKNQYPLITVERNYNSGVITVKQEPFRAFYTHRDDEQNDECWIIPLSFTTKKEQEFKEVVAREWLTCDTPLSITISNIGEQEWVLFNLKMSVFGRVHYDLDNWQLIQKSLRTENNFSGIDALTRAHLISDMFALAEIGKLSYLIVLETMKYLEREENYAPWKVVLTEFKKIWIILLRTELLAPFENYVRNILAPIFKKEKYQFNDWDDFLPNEKSENLLNQILMELSCKVGMEACQEVSNTFTSKWKKKPADEWSERIPININTLIHCQAVKYGENEYKMDLFDRHYILLESYSSNIVLEALGCSENSSFLKWYLKQCIHSEILEDDCLKIFKNLTSNREGYKILMRYLKNYTNSISKMHENDQNKMKIYLHTLLEVTNTQTDLDKLLKLFRDNSKIFGLMFNNMYLEKAERNILWLQEYRKILTFYFHKKPNKAKIMPT